MQVKSDDVDVDLPLSDSSSQWAAAGDDDDDDDDDDDNDDDAADVPPLKFLKPVGSSG